MNRILFFTLVFSVCFSFLSQAQKYACFQGISVDILPTRGDVTVNASQFFVDFTDGKELPTDLRIEKLNTSSGAFGNGVPSSNMAVIGCVGVVAIRLWVKYPNMDWDYCDTYVDVQNSMGGIPKDGNCLSCHYPVPPRIYGSVLTPNGKTLANLVIKFETNITNHNAKVVSGSYVAYASTSNKFYPIKDDLPLNGVSTFDLVLISRHILGTQLITDKFASIAADINNNDKITTADVVELRKLVLGINKDFTNNKSWRFFDKNMNEEVVLNNLKLDTMVNFTAVKIGDINGNANPTSAPRALNTHIFQAEDATLAAGETTTLALNGTEGFGFTLRYAADNLELIDLDENSALLENGLITTVQIGSVFKATFRAKADVTLSKAILINSDITKAEAVVNGELNNVALQFKNNSNTLELFQNQPNPFSEATKISFNLPNASFAKITISDLTGRVLKTIENDFPKGYNELSISGLQQIGVLYYTLETPTNRVTRKMLQVE